MGDILFHSKSSAQKFGGLQEDYHRVHSFLDSSKLYLGDWRHRALFHHTGGIELCEKLFGHTFKRNSDQEEVCTRTIATQHIIEDMSFLPSPSDWLKELPLKTWMNGVSKGERMNFQTSPINIPKISKNYKKSITSEIVWLLFPDNNPVSGDYVVACTGKSSPISATWNNKEKIWTSQSKDITETVKYFYKPTFPL